MDKPKVLMLGWEYPPNFAGGLGIATQGMVEALGPFAEVDLWLPFEQGERETSVQGYSPYEPPDAGLDISEAIRARVEGLRKRHPPAPSKYGDDLMQQVEAFAAYVDGRLQEEAEFDLIHAHDWMTFPAALKAQERLQKPLILHIHSLETDRCADPAVNNPVSRLETHAIGQADAIFAVSEYTKEALVSHYHADEERVSVVYNGTPEMEAALEEEGEGGEADYEWPWELPEAAKGEPPKEEPEWMKPYNPAKSKKQVLFLGRITPQKGPLTFIRTAKRLLDEAESLSFIVAGLGEQLEEMMGLAEQENISSFIDFRGFVDRSEIRSLLEEATVLFMPSVSEPFGLVALEAAAMGLPVVASKQSGMMEVLPGVLTAEYWDSKQFARHLRMITQYQDLREGLGRANKAAVAHLTWDHAAEEIAFQYQKWQE